MAGVGFADWLIRAVGRQDDVGTIARLWDQGDTGKITSVSGVKRWFDEYPPDQGKEWVAATLAAAVREYTSERQTGEGKAASKLLNTPTESLDRMERIEAHTQVLPEVLERLGGVEQALAWLVDAQSAWLEQQQLQARSMEAQTGQDYRAAIGGDATRSEAEAMGLVSPAPPRSDRPGYEHVLPPGGWASGAQPAQVEDIIDAGALPPRYPQPPVDNSPGQQQVYPQPVENPQVEAYQVQPGPEQVRAAIAAEAARIQGAQFRGSDPGEGVYYDGPPPGDPSGSQAPGYYPERAVAPSASDWKAWAQGADYSGDDDQQ